ncbi:Plant invertase/pectin methylesterase inhibitor superfamily protein [Hibiscus syriacus]|uniref:Plant invertase/pectin methylesterase inhibitor superfamily protein n=1 Tax=Hibiscus syriacus TaxID=106335 RepID=A0A6A2Y7R3_HIBSY|nr:Plant invertase/pectin methylesterase inhibitor superfamily protein [Hibiscus syriacus]
MNQLLDSRVEALAFNYVSFGIYTIFNNLWAWVAVITAALKKNDSFTRGFNFISPASVTKTVVSQSVCNDGATKGGMPKLTVYYYNDIGEKTDVVGDTTETGWSDGDGYRKEGSCGGEWWESWERVLRLRKGERGWYRYQDFTAINGNVVRLWDDRVEEEGTAQAVLYGSWCFS